jgi:hypothetical protein
MSARAAFAAAGFLFAYLIAVVGTHAGWNRLAPSAAAPQGRALLTALFHFVLFLGVASIGAWRTGAPLAWLPYLAVCLLCVAYCYWSLICLSESGRRYRIAHMVLTGEAEHADDILRIYNSHVIIRARLDRLVQWGEVEINQNRYVCRRGRVYWASVAVRSWARLLGFRWFT